MNFSHNKIGYLFFLWEKFITSDACDLMVYRKPHPSHIDIKRLKRFWTCKQSQNRRRLFLELLLNSTIFFINNYVYFFLLSRFTCTGKDVYKKTYQFMNFWLISKPTEYITTLKYTVTKQGNYNNSFKNQWTEMHFLMNTCRSDHRLIY